MNSSTVLDLLADRLRTLGAAIPDLEQLRAVAAYAQVVLKAIELTDIEARITTIEAARR